MDHTPSESEARPQPRESTWIQDCDEKQFILEEYKTLRQEILNHQGFIHQINTLGVTLGAGLGALLTIAPSSKFQLFDAYYLFLAFSLMYFPLIMGQVYRRRKEMRIGRYIECMIEARVKGLYWEHTWSREAIDALPYPALFESGVLIVLQVLYAIAAALSLNSAWEVASYIYVFVFVLLLGIEIRFVTHVVFDVKPFVKEWQAVRKRCFPDAPSDH